MRNMKLNVKNNQRVRQLLMLISGGWFLILFACSEVSTPKPDAFLRLDYPKSEYQFFIEEGQRFGFEKNIHTEVIMDKDGAFKIDYPFMKASVYINYRPVQNNLMLLLKDAQKLTYNHTIKADDIQESMFEHPEKKVYGMFYRVMGDAATNVQFYATDSLQHFVVGTLYFYAKPNFDSIYPATKYIENDMMNLMETLEWVNK